MASRIVYVGGLRLRFMMMWNTGERRRGGKRRLANIVILWVVVYYGGLFHIPFIGGFVC